MEQVNGEERMERKEGGQDFRYHPQDGKCKRRKNYQEMADGKIQHFAHGTGLNKTMDLNPSAINDFSQREDFKGLRPEVWIALLLNLHVFLILVRSILFLCPLSTLSRGCNGQTERSPHKSLTPESTGNTSPQ